MFGFVKKAELNKVVQTLAESESRHAKLASLHSVVLADRERANNTVEELTTTLEEANRTISSLKSRIDQAVVTNKTIASDLNAERLITAEYRRLIS